MDRSWPSTCPNMHGSPYLGASCAVPRTPGSRDSTSSFNILYGLCLTGEKSVQLVMEYVPLGSLRDYLPRHSVGLAQLLLFAQQICEVGWPHPSF